MFFFQAENLLSIFDFFFSWYDVWFSFSSIRIHLLKGRQITLLRFIIKSANGAKMMNFFDFKDRF